MALPVLVVEDHESSRRALVRILTSRGIRSVSVGSVADAFNAARGQRFAAVLSDIGLPDGDGYELMGALRTQYNLPCVAMTAFDEIADPRVQAKVQLLARLTKPLHIQEIDTVIESLRSRLMLSAGANDADGLRANGNLVDTPLCGERLRSLEEIRRHRPGKISEPFGR